jgi:hypothetical protein
MANLCFSFFGGKVVKKKNLTWQLISRPAIIGLLAIAAMAFFGFASNNSYAVSSLNKTSGRCSLSTLQGTYLFSDNGFTITGSKQSPFADAGYETFDGSGHVHGIFTQSDNGKISRLVTYTGTYSVTSQCTGSETIKDATGTTSHFDQFIAPDGHALSYVETDSGVVSSASTLETRVSN